MKYKPINVVKILVGLMVVAVVVIVATADVKASHVSPEVAIAQTASCLVLLRNTDLEVEIKTALEKKYTEVLDSYIPAFPELVIKYLSRSEGFLVGVAFGRYGDDNKSISTRGQLVTIANELFVKYCALKSKGDADTIDNTI